MYSIKNLKLIILLLCCFKVVPQSDFETLGESSLDVNHKFSQNYSINTSVRSRYYLYKDLQFTFEQRQIDVAHFSNFKLNYNHDLSFGIQYRNRGLFSNSANELRITEQFNYNKKLQFGIRLGHRIRSEQRLLNTETIFRQRYRLAIDFPLNGEKLDIGEAYFVAALEGLLSLSEISKPEIDQRTTAQVGWQLSETLKLQTGLEFRFEAFNIKTQNLLFVLTSVILKI